jgi:hypothetical protein
MRKILSVFAIAALTAAAQAQIWNEVGDAPVRPLAQNTVGVGALAQIDGLGEFDAAGLIDVDMYCVHIDGNWAATTVGGATWDTMLALYQNDGVTQITFNDDSVGLQSTISGALPAGDYHLGITRFADFGWDDGGGQGSSPYSIFLTGMSYCEVPEPASLALLALGALAVIRRR